MLCKLGGPPGGQELGVPISRGKQRLLIWTPGSWPSRGPPSLASPILLPNNDSYRQNSALHFLFFWLDQFLIGVFRLRSWKKSDTILHNIHPRHFDPYEHIWRNFHFLPSQTTDHHPWGFCQVFMWLQTKIKNCQEI